MKKLVILLVLTLLLTLAVSITHPDAVAAPSATPQQTASAAATSTPSSTQPDPISRKAILQAYGDVLFGGKTYIQCNTYDDLTREAKLPEEITQWYGYEFEKPLSFTEFCLTDLDADGLPEIILRLSEDFGFELLRWEEGMVFGFPFVYRAMEDVTLEGDIFGDSGAFDSAWVKLRFAKDTYEQIETCRMQSTEAGGVQYFIGGQEVTESDYKAFIEGFAGKKRPTWAEFTKENFQTVMASLE